MRKILIVGANGQLAFDLIRIFSGNYEILKADSGNFDVADKIATESFIKNHAPNIVINTAAYHKTEECELNPEKSFAVNAIGAFNVAKAAKEVGAKIVFISTDYVFDGGKKYFTESDAPNPLNVYGASKLAGENLTKIANEDYFIIRTSWLFGIHKSGKGNNFVTLMLEKAKNGENIKVVNDQFGSPTYTYDLALKIRELIDKNIPSGAYHITNSNSCSWYEFAQKIFELTNMRISIEKIKSTDSPSRIKRPQYSVLISENLKKQGIESLRPWQDALGDFVLECNKK
ncbi:MAG: dTDP-4-dehydrorhamnose reductase [Candidatus Curtissbacteria bacterium GW2011_GWA1_40_24]|uniref:dTDP-4-dehydrorhamnose reductase n=1 Tax=Candidatus Curtissbacteria bacterium GW2011_GWA1_40_24 TaxID=1618406 RepID=A0A0G0U7G2_9BACT|nr:MAG: dTDP-4-dehydrorhamnose reductase [Candidatus Curtissbacteria bacterium GW2011_GWA1_40_24]